MADSGLNPLVVGAILVVGVGTIYAVTKKKKKTVKTSKPPVAGTERIVPCGTDDITLMRQPTGEYSWARQQVPFVEEFKGGAFSSSSGPYATEEEALAAAMKGRPCDNYKLLLIDTKGDGSYTQAIYDDGFGIRKIKRVDPSSPGGFSFDWYVSDARNPTKPLYGQGTAHNEWTADDGINKAMNKA
jgi:hypothetical protein